MRLRTILLLLTGLAMLLAAPQWINRTTPAEAQALHEAAQNHSAYTLPPAKLKQAEGLYRTRTILYFGGSAWSILQMLLLLELGVPSRLRDVATGAASNRLAQCFIFTLLLFGAIAVLDAPLALYGHHLGLAYGLSVQHWGSWLWDQVKSFLLAWIVGGMLVMVLFWVIRRSPARWWLWFWVPAMAAVLFGVFLSPILVDPLFNKFEPLQQSNPALVQQLEKVVARSGISLPPDRMFYMRASSKVTGLNAYVTGFGPSKRLVLWDTTIAHATPDELSSRLRPRAGPLRAASHRAGAGLYRSSAARGLLPRPEADGVAAASLWSALAHPLAERLGLPRGAAAGAEYVCRSSPRHSKTPSAASIEHAADVYGQEAIHGIVADPQAVDAAGLSAAGRDLARRSRRRTLSSSSGPTVIPPSQSRAAFAAAYNPWIAGQTSKIFLEVSQCD